MQPLIAVRIKDGLFVGNATAAQDDEFLFLNKVQHVVNCCSTEVSNLYAQANIQYLAFPWKDIPSTVMFDSHDRNVDQIFKFIERGLADGECVLVHSYFGLSRCCAIVAAYLMTKYGWTADSALTFMAVAHPDMAIKPHFLRQLRAFGKRQPLEPDIFYPYVDTTELALDNEQWAIRNTYLNALTSDIFQRHDIITVMKRHNLCPEFRSSVPVGSAADYHGRRISFVDTKQGTTVASNVTVPVQHNPVRAGPGRPARPILVNTDYTPQRHLLLSPVSIDPKGRQAFRVIDSEKEDTKQSSSHMHHQQAHFYNHSAEFPDYNSQNTYRNFTNSGHSPASANHPSLTQRPKLNNTVHSPFILKAANSARKGSPMPETRRLLRTRQPENAPERSTNSPRSQREQQSTGLSRPIPSRTNSPITVRQQATGTPPPNRNSPSHARDMNPPVPRKLTYNSVNLRQPQRTGSPTQRKTTTNQIADSPVGQYTLGMGLRSLYDREPNLSASSNTYGSRPASATNMNGIQQKQLVSSHSARAGTPTDRFHTYGPSPTSLGNRSAMSSRKLARP